MQISTLIDIHVDDIPDDLCMFVPAKSIVECTRDKAEGDEEVRVRGT
jgi:hypothetical protein